MNHCQHAIHPTQIWFELIQEIHVRKNLKGSVMTKSFHNFGIRGSKFKYSKKHGISRPPKSWVAQTLASTLLIESHNLSVSLTISQPI